MNLSFMGFRTPILAQFPSFNLKNFWLSDFVNARCSDLVLYPVSAVDQSDQYRFDYSDVSFGNTHSQGASVTITCTTGGQPATVEGYDQV